MNDIERLLLIVERLRQVILHVHDDGWYDAHASLREVYPSFERPLDVCIEIVRLGRIVARGLKDPKPLRRFLCDIADGDLTFESWHEAKVSLWGAAPVQPFGDGSLLHRTLNAISMLYRNPHMLNKEIAPEVGLREADLSASREFRSARVAVKEKLIRVERRKRLRKSRKPK